MLRIVEVQGDVMDISSHSDQLAGCAVKQVGKYTTSIKVINPCDERLIIDKCKYDGTP